MGKTAGVDVNGNAAIFTGEVIPMDGSFFTDRQFCFDVAFPELDMIVSWFSVFFVHAVGKGSFPGVTVVGGG